MKRKLNTVIKPLLHVLKHCVAKGMVIFLAGFLFVSCEDWLDVNEDPDAPTTVDYEYLLPAGISSVAYVVGGRYQVLGALWSQHWTQSPGASQYSGIDSYDINSSSFDTYQFGELYSGALQNLEYVRNGSLAEGEANYYLIATVMQGYIYQLLVDLYNQIPFSEALLGDIGIVEPKYEMGEDIYDSLIARLDEALSLDFSQDDLKDPAENDLLFNGAIDSWIAFANTLKLRLYLRQSEYNSTKAQLGIEAMYNAEVSFLDSDVLLDNVFSNEYGKRNPLYDTEYYILGGNPNLILSNTLYSFLIDNDDTDRLGALFNIPDDGGEHKALIQGDYYAPDEASGITSSSYSKPVMNATDPVYLLSRMESNLLQAEAIVRYNVADYSTAKELYDKAILLSYERILSDDSDDIYYHAQQFINGVYAFPSEGSSVESFRKSIATQKWLCLSGIQNLEVFFEINRTGYPVKSTVPGDDSNYEPGELTVSVNNVTSGKFPKRLVFPESEYASNRNTPAKKEVWENVWWDIN
jgi:hypothetical protein